MVTLAHPPTQSSLRITTVIPRINAPGVYSYNRSEPPAFIRDPEFIYTIDLDPPHLFETQRLIETRHLFGDLR